MVEHAPTAFGPASALSPTFTNIDATHFLVTYTIRHSAVSTFTCTDAPIYATILTVNAAAGIVSAGRANTLPGKYAAYYSPSTYTAGAIARIDPTHFLFVHSQCSSAISSSEGHAEILAVDLAGDNVTVISSFAYDTVWNAFNSTAQVDSTHFLVAYQTASDLGMAALLTISGNALSQDTPSVAFTTIGQYHKLLPLTTGRLLNVYRGSGNRGAARVITVGSSPLSVQLGTEYAFDSTASYSGGSVLALDAQNFLAVYRAVTTTTPTSHGRAAILNVTMGNAISPISNLSDFPMPVESGLQAAGISGSHFLASYATSGATGQVVPLAASLSPAQIAAGTTISCDSAGCASIVATIDGSHLLGVRTQTDTHLAASVMEIQCPFQ